MAVLISHASKDEHGNIKGGQGGDQTGKEVCIREWYNRPWNVVIRFKSQKKADAVADCMEWAAANDNIGYNQLKRNEVLNKGRKYNYNVSKIKEPCNCDCSSIVSVACMYAGIPESALTLNGNCATTSTLRRLLMQTGEVEVFTTPQYTAKTDKLKRGDILLSEGHHTGAVVKVDNTTKKSVHDVALDCINGKYGTGNERRARLISAGYNPDEVQAEINSILKTQKSKSTEQVIWDYLMSKIGNAYGVAGLMGNLQAESRLNPKNLQNSCEKRLGMNDETYTAAVDSGAYKNFVTDSCGYGLAQWTSSGRKQGLLNSRGNRSIGDLMTQLEFLWTELQTGYKGVLNALRVASSVRAASDVVLKKFERPENQSEDVQKYRANLGREFYDKYAR